MFSPASVFGSKGRPFQFSPSKRRAARPPRLRSPSIVHSFYEKIKFPRNFVFSAFRDCVIMAEVSGFFPEVS